MWGEGKKREREEEGDKREEEMEAKLGTQWR